MTEIVWQRSRANCAECLSILWFDSPPARGEILNCPECQTALEVVQANPLKLTWAYEEPLGDDLSQMPRYELDDSYLE